MAGLKLSDVHLLLENDYLPMEAGWAMTEDNMVHVAGSTYMEGCSSDMVDWWFGYIHNTEQYKWWHPRDHVFSDWDGPRENRSEYIGGHHLVHEYIGDQLEKLKISFKDPAEYFGPEWKDKFQRAGYGTAICGRVGIWEPEMGKVTYTGHLIHPIKNEPGACRMRSRFWLGDIEDVGTMGDKVPESMRGGLCKHATEEMSILASKLPDLYRKYSNKANL